MCHVKGVHKRHTIILLHIVCLWYSGTENMALNTNDRHVTEDLYILNAVVTSFSGLEKTTISPSSKYIEVLCTTVDFFSTHVSSVKALDMVSCKKIKHRLCVVFQTIC